MSQTIIESFTVSSFTIITSFSIIKSNTIITSFSIITSNTIYTSFTFNTFSAILVFILHITYFTFGQFDSIFRY